MYAIIQTGGKQYTVEEGNTYEVELLEEMQNSDIVFNEVLLLNDGTNIIIGNPTIKNCIIKAQIIDETKGPKVVAFKYKKRKNYHRKKGHRQKYSKIKITKIELAQEAGEK